MAQDFNTGPNAAPGGAPENARVNDAAMNAELKQAQILQNNTIKGLTDTIDKLTKQYEELTQSGKELSQDEANVSKQLQDKIQDLSEVLKNMKDGIAKGEKPTSLSSIGQKERIQTFDRLTSVIKDFQKSNAEFIKSSGGDALDFDTWFASYTAQRKTEIDSLEASEDNNLLLGDIKKILKSQSSELAGLTDEELTDVAKKSLRLSVDEKKRDLEFYEQNKDIIRLNKLADEHEQEGVKKIISSAKFDATKPILEYGFKSINKDMDALIKNTKHRSLLQIVADLLGPMGHIIVFMIKVLFIPLAVVLGLLVGVVEAQFIKLREVGKMFSGEFFTTIFRNLKVLFSDAGPLMKLWYAFTWLNNKIFGFGVVWSKFGIIAGDITNRFALIGNKLVSAVKFILPPIIGLGNKLTAAADFLMKPFGMLTSFLNTRSGMIFLIADRFLGGIFHAFNTFRKIGRVVGGIVGPVAAIFNIFKSLPDFFHRLFHGTFKEGLKAIMGMIVFVFTQFFSQMLGPIGGIIALTIFNFERIMKWFDPIFDFLIDIAMWLGGTLLVVWEYGVKPLVESVSEFLTAFLDTVFAIAKPVIRWMRFIWDIVLKPLLVIAGVALIGLSYVLKYVFKGLGLLFTEVILPAVTFVGDIIETVFDTIEDSLIAVMNYMINWVNKIGKWLGFSKIDTMTTSAQKKEQEKLATEAIKKQELEEKNKKGMHGAVKDGVIKGMERAQEVIKDLYSLSKEEASGMLGVLTDAFSGDGSKIGQLANAATEGLKTGFSAIGGALDRTGISNKIDSGINTAKVAGKAAFQYINTPTPSMQYATNANPNMDQQYYANKAMGFTPPTNRSEIINNNNNVYNTTSGGGSSILPIISGGHTDPTKVSLQIGLRPPG